MDLSNTAITEINESGPNGEVVQSLVVTPYEATFRLGYDDAKIQPGYEAFDSVQSVMLDADGKVIRDKVGMFPTTDYNLAEITNIICDAGRRHLRCYSGKISRRDFPASAAGISREHFRSEDRDPSETAVRSHSCKCRDRIQRNRKETGACQNLLSLVLLNLFIFSYCI